MRWDGTGCNGPAVHVLRPWICFRASERASEMHDMIPSDEFWIRSRLCDPDRRRFPLLSLLAPPRSAHPYMYTLRNCAHVALCWMYTTLHTN